MSYESIMLIGWTIATAITGWLLRQGYSDIKQIANNLEAFRINVAENYVRQDRMEKALEKALEPIAKNIERIEAAVSTKADKANK